MAEFSQDELQRIAGRSAQPRTLRNPAIAGGFKPSVGFRSPTGIDTSPQAQLRRIQARKVKVVETEPEAPEPVTAQPDVSAFTRRLEARNRRVGGETPEPVTAQPTAPIGTPTAQSQPSAFTQELEARNRRVGLTSDLQDATRSGLTRAQRAASLRQISLENPDLELPGMDTGVPNISIGASAVFPNRSNALQQFQRFLGEDTFR